MAVISRKAIFLLIVCAAATSIVDAIECIEDKGAKKCKDAGDCPSGQTCLNLYRGQSGKNHVGVCGAPQGEGCDCDPSLDYTETCANGFRCKENRCSRRGCSYKCTEPTPDEIAVYLECKDGAASKWQQVYEHDNDGNSVSGSKADLVAAVRRGAQVKVLNSYGAFPVQSVIVGANGDEVHAQMLFYMPRPSTPKGDDLFRYYLTQSTTGNVQYSYYYPGYSYAAKPYHDRQNLNSYRPAVWFVREPGIPIGSTGSLVSAAVGQGATVRGVLGQTTKQLSAVSAGAPGTSSLSGQLLWHMQSGNDGQGFTTDETLEFSTVNSTGITTASMLVQDQTAIVSPPVANDAKWFVDTCWTDIYSHDETGMAVSGSLTSLVQEILSGKPVRINIDGTLYDIDFRRVANDELSVTAQVYNRMDDDISEPTWRWLEVTTDGTKIEITNRYGADNAYVVTSGTSAIKWYTKNEAWEEMDLTDAVAYQAAMDEGADVCFSINRNGQTEIRTADVMRASKYLYNERELQIDGQVVYQKRNFLTTGGDFREKVYLPEGMNIRDDVSTVSAKVFRN